MKSICASRAQQEGLVSRVYIRSVGGGGIRSILGWMGVVLGLY